MQRVWRDEVAYRPERVDRGAQPGREPDGRPDEQASIGEPDHRHARGVGEAIERRDWAVGDPDLGAEWLQVLLIEAHKEAVQQVRARSSVTPLTRSGVSSSRDVRARYRVLASEVGRKLRFF